jgi:regulator of RNase E activity RraA
VIMPEQHRLARSSSTYCTTVHMSESLTLAQSDLTTCEISDALLKLGVPHGGHIPDIHCISPHSHSRTNCSAGRRLCGPAYTVRMVLASERDEPKLQGAHFVDLAPEGSVVFVSAPPGWSSALFTSPIRSLLPPTVCSHYAPLHFTPD